MAGVLIVPAMSGALPERLADAMATYWPTNAGLQLVLNGSEGLAPWTGFGLMCAFVAAVVALPFAVLHSRDA